MFYATDKHGKTHWIQGTSRPSHTGMGLTEKQLNFFKVKRGMQDIAKNLFSGDYWEANAFQNKFYSNGVLQMDDACKFSLIEW